MGSRRLAIAIACTSLSAMLAIIPNATSRATVGRNAAAAVTGGSLPFTVSGELTKIALGRNQLTVTLPSKRHDVIIVNSTTTVTIKSKRQRLTALKVGETVRVSGVRLGSLLLGTRIVAS